VSFGASSGEGLEFPLLCHFKVVAYDQPEIMERIEEVLKILCIESPVIRGNQSSKGKYQTYNVSILVNSREEMQKIDQKFRAIDGVVMVL